MNQQADFDFTQVSGHYYTKSQLEKIKYTRIGIAGAGGLGTNCALALVRCGFEKFVIADFDIVSISNLNRQQFLPADIGKLKVECLRRNLTAINSSIDCIAFQEMVTITNIHSMFTGCQVVVEAFDNAESKAMLVSEMISTEKLVVSASGLAGYGNSDRIITRKIRDNFYLIGDSVSEVGDGTLPYAPCVMIAAAKQADVVLQWILGT